MIVHLCDGQGGWGGMLSTWLENLTRRMKMSKLSCFSMFFFQLPGLAHVRKVKTSSCRSSILRSEMTTISKTQTNIYRTLPNPQGSGKNGGRADSSLPSPPIGSSALQDPGSQDPTQTWSAPS